jgi:hypothetical protein
MKSQNIRHISPLLSPYPIGLAFWANQRGRSRLDVIIYSFMEFLKRCDG